MDKGGGDQVDIVIEVDAVGGCADKLPKDVDGGGEVAG